MDSGELTNISNTSDKGKSDEVVIEKKDKVALFSRTVGLSVSRGFVSPFVSIIALSMGAGAGILAWIQSIANLLSTFLNPVFGLLSDKLKKRIPFIIFSTITWGIPYIFLQNVKQPVYFILIIGVVNLLLSLGIPSSQAFQNEVFPPKERAELSGKIFWYDAIGSMIATIFTGIILTFIFFDQNYQETILIPVIAGIVLSVISVIPFFRIKEPSEREGTYQQITRKLGESFKHAFRNKKFKRCLLISMFYSFFWSFAWPLFPIKQYTILGAKAIEIAILSILFSVSTICFIGLGAKLSDKIGRVKLITFSRFIMGTFPLFYILATEIWHLYLVHFIISSFVSLGASSFTAYLMDITPKEEGGSYFGIFNMITGLFFFLGALAGGYLVEVLDMFFTLPLALGVALALSSCGRFIISIFYLTMEEVKTFPTSLKGVFSQLIERRKEHKWYNKG